MPGIHLGKRVGSSAFSWSSYWASLISAVIENANPDKLVVTFGKANTNLLASDFSLTGTSLTIQSLARNVDNTVFTFTLSGNAIYGDVISLVFGKVPGSSQVVTNNVLIVFPSANSDIVNVSSIDEIQSSGTVIAAKTSPGYSWINYYKGERIRQNSTITRVSYYVTGLITHPVLMIYRKDGSTYDRVGQVDLAGLISPNQVNNIILPSSIIVTEGDYVCWQLIHTGTNAHTIGTSADADSVRYKTDSPSETNYDWDSGTGSANKIITHCKSSAPLIATIGDSIMESYPWHTSMVDVTRATVYVSRSWQYKLKGLDSRFTYQNLGVGAETTTQIQSRWDRDVVACKPKFAVINGGVNDLAGGLTKANFLTQYESMLDSCVTNNIIPIVWKIMPWTNGSNANMRLRDEWNADLVTLFNTYDIDGKIIIDWDADLGQYRATGDAGNLWDIKTEYNQDNVHFNLVGQDKIAEVMLREIGKVFDLS